METGIYYRGFASLFYQNQVNILDLTSFISNININDFKEYIALNYKKLYSTTITKLSSELAKNLEIRLFIIQIQQNMIITLKNNFNGIILEGRDCGSVVAPKADLSFTLTASLKVRAERRFNQFIKDKRTLVMNKCYSDLRERDVQDKNRTFSFTKTQRSSCY